MRESGETMKLSGWARLWIVASALAVSGCEDQAKQERVQAIEEEAARTAKEVQLLERIEKRQTELLREAERAGHAPVSGSPN